uniref:PAS domain-containing protein n=1 Tax=Microcebus murinus TaxID=30608 RepID=A0A8C5YA79_MICMU
MTMGKKERRGKINPEGSQEKPSWIPSFHTYEDFNRKALQSIDGFMIILSTDGVITFVAENISSLLGHLPADIVGKKLLSLLPDKEKNEVYRKIILKLPLSNSGGHIEFCCHLKKGSVEQGSSPAYEYVKFILSVKDFSNEPFVIFSSYFPKRPRVGSSVTNLWEDRFYLVGTVCILRVQTLQELCSAKESSGEVVCIQDSDEECFSKGRRSVHHQRSSRMGALRAESTTAAAFKDQVDIVEVEQYGPQETLEVIRIRSDSSCESSTSSLETMPESPAMLSLHSFEYESDVDLMNEDNPVDLDTEDSVEQQDLVDSTDTVDLVEQEGLMDIVDLVDQQDAVNSEYQEDLIDLEAAGTSAQPSQPSLSIASYIDNRDLELLEKFREQLEERTRVLQAIIKSQQDALQVIKEQLQVQPTATCRIVSPDPQSLGAVPKKQRTGQVKRSLPDIKEAKRFCDSYSFPSLKFIEKFEEPSLFSTQQEQKKLRQQPQQLQKQPQQHSAIAGNQTLQKCLRNPIGMSVPLYNNPVTFLQTKPIVVPVQMIAEPQPSDSYQEEDLGCQENESHSFLPEAHQGPPMDQPPLGYSSSTQPISSTSFPQSPINPEVKLPTLETPEDYIQLWQQSPDPQGHLFLQANIWPSNEQASMQGQDPWNQIQVPKAGAQDPPGPEAFQGPSECQPQQMRYFLPAEQPYVDEQQQQQQQQQQ